MYINLTHFKFKMSKGYYYGIQQYKQSLHSHGKPKLSSTVGITDSYMKL
jgi:hypothetical protein